MPSPHPGGPRRRWRLPAPAPPADLFSQSIHPVVRRVLSSRGLADGQEQLDFLEARSGNDDPFLLADMQRAVARLQTALQRDELVAVYGDFDADGVTGVAVLLETISSLGGRAIPFLPHRERDGYGVHPEAVDELARAGAAVIVTVDCGIRAQAAVAAADAHGIDVIVTDHHLLPEVLPQALAVINPHRSDCRYGYTGLAGVGLAYKLAQALVRTAELVPAGGGMSRSAPAPPPGSDLEERLLDLVAIGTVADVVPLVGENRALVRRGLEVLRRSGRPGLKALLEITGEDPSALTARSVAWSIAPRVNAAGRMDDADAALRLLMATVESDAVAVAEELEARNQLRREATESALADAEDLLGTEVDAPFLFVESTSAPVGVLGLVAGKLAERHYRPVAAVRVEDNVARASLRSIPELDIVAALDSVAHLLERYGGHARAAGFTTSADNLPLVREGLTRHARGALDGLDLRPVVTIDAEIAASEANWPTYRALEQLEPHGEANPRPVLLIRGAPIVQPRLVGQSHLRFRVEGGPGVGPLGCIAFGQGDRLDDLGATADLVGTLREDVWQGQHRLELRVIDFAGAERTTP